MTEHQSTPASRGGALRRAQVLFRKAVPAKATSLADELIPDWRREAQSDGPGANSSTSLPTRRDKL